MGLDGWSYYATYTQPGSSDGDLTDQKIQVTISYQSFMNTDFSDIRFCANDGETLLSSNRVSYSTSSTATFEVKLPSLPSSGIDIILYAGNSAATDASDPDSVYLFDDAFPGTSIDPTKWTVNAYGAITQTVNAKLQITTCNQNNFLYGGQGPGSQDQAICSLPSNYEVDTKQIVHGGSTQLAESGIALVDSNGMIQLLVGHWKPASASTQIYGWIISANEITNINSPWSIPTPGSGYRISCNVSDLDIKSYRIVVNGLNVSIYDGSTLIATTTLSSSASKLSILATRGTGTFFTYYEFDSIRVFKTTPNPPSSGSLSSWTHYSTSLSFVFPAGVSIVPYGGILIEDTNNIILSEMYYTVQRGMQSDIKEVVLVNQSSSARTVTLTPTTSTSQDGSANETYNSQFLSVDGITYTNSVTVTVPASGTKTIYTKYAPPDNAVPGAKEWKLATSQNYSLPFTMPTGWNYVSLLPITGSVDGDYSNIPVTVQIPFDGNVMKDNYGDIRFYSSDGTALNYELVSTLGGLGTFKVLIPSLPVSPAVTKIFAIAGEDDATTTSTTVTGTTPTTAPTVGSIGAWQYYGGLQVKADVQYTKQEIEGLDYETSIGVWIGGVYYE